MKKTNIWKVYIIIILGYSISACDTSKKETEKMLFTPISSLKMGIKFENKLTPKKQINPFNYRNFYSGAGVAVGDINNDELIDIFFINNMEDNRLYLNKGNLQFEDISDKANIQGNKTWSSAVTMVDINNDGYLDIYVTNSGGTSGQDQRNELYVNNGDLTFSEKAAEYMLDDNGFGTQTVFFDADLDSDLDAYILNNSFIPISTLNYSNRRDIQDTDWNVANIFKKGGDKLMINENGYFKDYTKEAGIYSSLIGMGLAVAVGDINEDGYPDIYVANDDYEQDYLYINQKNNTFKDELPQRIPHTSKYTTGVEIQDINNDGYLDIFTTDRVPESEERNKQIRIVESPLYQKFQRKNNFHHQFMQNTLQLNQQKGKFFQEVSNLFAISKSDWSYSGLVFDADNDGYKDIFIANGIPHDITDNDYINNFKTNQLEKKIIIATDKQITKFVNEIPSTPIANKIWKNNNNKGFIDMTSNWGIANIKTFSSGAVFADLDNDGDYDIIVNNTYDMPTVYKNNANELVKNNFIKIKLIGKQKHTFVLGATIWLYYKDSLMIRNDQTSVRGHLSSMAHRSVNIGIGKSEKIDSILVRWSKDNYQLIKKEIEINKELVIKYTDSLIINKPSFLRAKEDKIFSNIPFKATKLVEDEYFDFEKTPFLFKKYSSLGPTISTADINKDGKDDFFVGSPSNQSSTIYQSSIKGYKQIYSQSLNKDKIYEDTASCFVDINGDGFLDLVVGSGGNNSLNTEIRYYLNDKKGKFLPSKKIIKTQGNVTVVLPIDFDNDGDNDLFIGTNKKINSYQKSKHYILENKENEVFVDVTNIVAKELQHIHSVTNAVWENINADENKELIIVGQWEAPKIFSNNNGKFSLMDTNLKEYIGIWNYIAVSDLNGDGKKDIILGNMGENMSYKASKDNAIYRCNVKLSLEEEKNFFAKDTENGIVPLLDYYQFKKLFPKISDILQSVNLYSKQNIEQLFLKESTKIKLQKVNATASIIAINQGNQSFKIKHLPTEAQYTSVNNIIVEDINQDGNIDLILGGNEFDILPQFGRLDAASVTVFLGKKDNTWKYIPPNKLGIKTKGMVRDMKILYEKEEPKYILLGINNEAPELYNINISK